MNHPLYDSIAAKLAGKVASGTVALWFDPRREFEPFVTQWRASVQQDGSALPLGTKAAHLIEFSGSFLAVRAAAEVLTGGDEPQPVVIYLGGQSRQPQQSILLELEKAGKAWEGWSLKAIAREVLSTRYTDGIIDDWLEGTATYADLSSLCMQASDEERPSLLKAIFAGLTESAAVLAAWIASPEHDDEIDSKGAATELRQLLASRAGLDVVANESSLKMRMKAIRHILGAEFRSDLQCEVPPSLQGLPKVARKEHEAFIRDIAKRLRREHPAAYEALADRVEDEYRIRDAAIDALHLGAIDTFRHEERAMLRRCGDLIAEGDYMTAVARIEQRENSFWLERDVERRAQWRAARLVAELGVECLHTEKRLASLKGNAAKWVSAYADADGGMHQADLRYRKAEALLASIDEGEDLERAVGVVRRRYEDLAEVMADRFLGALEAAEWTVPEVLHQTSVFDSVVRSQERTTAYFLVDALRFEMGAELANTLAPFAEVELRPVIAAIPTITPIGMGALQPDASKSFSVVEQKTKLGVLVEKTLLTDAASRKKFMAGRAPASVDIMLDKVLSLSSQKLAKEIGKAPLVIVRSTEIDSAGESGYAWSRGAIESMIGNLARAIRKLAAAGIEVCVVSADHGHQFSLEKDQSLKIEPPNGGRVELHRRCWIGRGGTTPAGTIRVKASQLGYQSDLDFVFPRGIGVFKAGGDASFHHGGLSLQELVIPLLTVRLKKTTATPQRSVRVTGAPDRITNRIFSITLTVEDLFGDAIAARVVLLSDGREAGRCELVTTGEMDTNRSILLRRGEPVTVVMLLSDEKASRVRLSVLDESDFELWGADITVELGVA